MQEDKKRADALDKQSANNNSNANVAQSAKNVKQGKKSKGSYLVMRSDVRTLSIKCYQEQLTFVKEDLRKELAEVVKSIPKDKYWVIAIIHDRDPEEDEIWGSSLKKLHVHIFMKAVNPSHAHVSTYLNAVGVEYRPGIDDELWKNHGVETCQDFSACAMYATHESADAIAKGKTVYEFDEIISNLTSEEVQAIRAGYKVLSAAKKLSAGEWEELKAFVCHLALESKSFTEWYNDQPLAIQSHSKMKTLEKLYQNTLDALMANEPLPACLNMDETQRESVRKLTRLCVFIQGEKNVGKTFAAEAALSGKRRLTIAEGGTGRFDKLNVCTEAMILDDGTCPSLLNVCDDYKTVLYKRGSGNPYWCGRYFIVTSNLTFKEWVEKCGFVTEKRYGGDTETLKALKSRFFICSIRQGNDGKNGLYVESCAERGTQAELEERLRMFNDFREKYDKTIGDYQKGDRDMSIFDNINAARYSEPKAEEPPADPKPAGELPTDEEGFIQYDYLAEIMEDPPFF